MSNINQLKEMLDLCNGAHNKRDVNGWTTLHEFDNSSKNIDFDVRVYKQGNRIVIAFAGTNMNSKNDKLNDVAILNPLNHIPSQFGDAERLYNKVKSKYPNANIEFTGYSLGGSIANLMSHRTGLPSTALAPIGSLHIANAYPQYFPYKGNNITTFGRKKDYFFYNNINKQSGNIFIVPDLSEEQINKFELAPQHLLHNYSPYQLYQAQSYKNNIEKTQIFGDITNSRIENTTKLNRTQLTGFASPVTNLTPEKIGVLSSFFDFPTVYQLPQEIYNYGLEDKTPVNIYNNNVMQYARFPKVNNSYYQNIPDIDFSEIFKRNSVKPLNYKSTSDRINQKANTNKLNNSVAQQNYYVDTENVIKTIINIIRNQKSDITTKHKLFNYKNPLTGSNRIFTREEVGKMSPQEFAKYEKEIDAQTKVFNGTMPTNDDLQREAMTGGGVVYVNSYTRSDGTKVNGYYRSKPKF